MLLIKEKLSKSKSVCICLRCTAEYVCGHHDALKSRLGDLCSACKGVITNMKDFTQSEVLQVFRYNKHTGDLTNIHKATARVEGALSTYRHNEGYLTVNVGKKEYLAHRMIWFMEMGVWPKQVDHINHNRSDNRWINLREVIHRDNHTNMSLKSNNTSGVNGVRVLPSKRYCAYIMVQGKQIPLGTYDTLEEAKSARENADRKYGFHVNHGS